MIAPSSYKYQQFLLTLNCPYLMAKKLMQSYFVYHSRCNTELKWGVDKRGQGTCTAIWYVGTCLKFTIQKGVILYDSMERAHT